MQVELINAIIAVVTHKKDSVNGGMAPTFFTANSKNSEELAFMIAKITTGMVHNLNNDIYVVVKH